MEFGQAGKRAGRVSYASSEEKIREATRRLREYLKWRG
jgi:aspartate/methionine/tyrosine aminotransferase